MMRFWSTASGPTARALPRPPLPGPRHPCGGLRRVPAEPRSTAAAARGPPGRGRRVEFAECNARLVGPTEGDQRLRPLQMPVTRGGAIAGRWIDLVQQPQRFGRTLFLHRLGGEIEPRAGIVRVACERLAQQLLGRVVTAGQAQEDGQIGRRRGMARPRLQRAHHCALGVLNRALAVAREAQIDPGVGEIRAKSDGGGKRLFGSRRLSGGDPGLTEGVMRLGHVGFGEAGIPCRCERRLCVAVPQRCAEIAQTRRRAEHHRAVRRRYSLRPFTRRIRRWRNAGRVCGTAR